MGSSQKIVYLPVPVCIMTGDVELELLLIAFVVLNWTANSRSFSLKNPWQEQHSIGYQLPSWLYKIIKTSLFESLLKCMKGDTDVLVLTSGILTITTLLPLVPASIGHCLQDLFDIFSRLSSFRARRPGNAPEVYLLHLHVAVYMFFHRLYAMYPNNFLAYLKVQFSEPSKQSLYQNTIKPMIEHVRLHPCFVTETVHSETEKHRWRQKEPHDIVIECMKLSLDPIDRIQEKGSFMSTWTSKQNCQELFADKSISSILTASCDSQGPEMSRLKERRMSDSATQTGKSLQSGDSGTDSCSLPVISSDEITAGWSPSDVCRLSTPPSSQMSPSTSNPDLLSSINIQSHCSTPGAIYTPGQSPTTSLGGDIAYHQGYSSSPSVSGSRGKSSISGWTHSGRGTPVRGGKAASHEGQLTRALYSALAQHSSESAPAAIGGHQTSTPKEPVKCEKDKNEGVSYDGHDLLTSQSNGTQSMFEVQGEETHHNLTRTTAEQFDSDNFNVSPKEEYRDFSGQEDFVSETSEGKSVESHEGVISSDFVPDSLTPVGGQSLDAVTLSNTPSDSVNVSASTCMSTETEESGISQPCYDFDSSVQSKELEVHEQPVSTELDKEHKLQEVNKSEMSLASYEASSEFSKFRSTSPSVQQNHHSSHTCDLIAAFPQLLPLFRSEQEHSGSSSLADADDAASLRLQQQLCGASPVEILDNYLKTGNSIHYGELSRIPLVSQVGTVWTHFGGDPPVDEVEILRGQVKLLHNQLLFERHKCDLHAIRNRRLIGKTFKAAQYQEELQATKDQLRLQEDKMRELTDALNKQVEENRRFKEITSSWDKQQRLQLRDLFNENTQLKYTQKELLEKLEAQQKDFDTKQTEINQVRARVFTLENELDRLKVEVSEKDQLSAQVNHLVKELLIMGEFNQQQKDAIQKLTLAEGQNPESNMQLHGCHRELGVAKQTVKKQKAELEAITSKLTDLETLVSSKDIELRELKKFTEGLKGTYTGKIKSLEEKYNAQKKITQALESYILDLQSSVDSKKEKIEHKP
ncbi:hamartin-like [Oculina patagonica]